MDPPTDARTRFVDDLGMHFEAVGSTRMTGRMIGWLTVCEPAHQSSEELASALQISSGGVSTTARALMSMGFVERVRMPRDRRAYYRLRPHAWTASIRQSAATTSHLKQLAAGALDTFATRDPRDDRLREMYELFDFFEREWPDLLRRFEERRRAVP